MFGMFRALCHEQPERSLPLLGEPMVVCSRCAGLYLGVVLGVALPLPRRWLPYGRAPGIGSIAFATIDVLTQDLGFHAPLHPVRPTEGASDRRYVTGIDTRAHERR